MLKKITFVLPITLIIIQGILVIGAKYETTSPTEPSFSYLLIGGINRFLPQLFWKHDLRIMQGPFGPAGGRQIWGYVDKHSIAPGESFNLMLSSRAHDTSVSGHIEIFRIGHYSDSDRKLVWKSNLLEVDHQKNDLSVASIGAGWIPTVQKIPTYTWQSGYYIFDFVTETGERDAEVAYLIVTNGSLSGNILVKISTNTYQAYNGWGGHSLYKSSFFGKGQKGQIVSFDRPTPSRFFQYEYYYVIWLEKLAHELGLKVDYATNFDIHSEPAYTKNYTLLIHVGHDEYWSKEEFDNTYNRIFVLGKNAMFLGANIAYWQVRYADVNGYRRSKPLGRQLITYKKESDPIRHQIAGDADLFVTRKFRHAWRRPETMLMGVAYCEGCWFKRSEAEHYPYYVEDTKFPFFKDTGYSEKEFVGNLIGYEWDNRDPVGDGKRLWDSEKSLLPEIPIEDIHVIFSGKAVDRKGTARRAEAVYFESKTGAKVFSAGTLGWSMGVGKKGYEQEKFKRFNRNLILFFMGMIDSKGV
jgi:hypothetical protein